MALDIIFAIVPTISEFAVVPLNRHIGDAFNHNSNVEQLKNQVKKLTDARESLQHSIEEAKRKGEEIEKNVQKWLTKVDKAIGDVAELINGDEQAKKKCFVGLCPNLKTRYELSKKAEKGAFAITELRNEGRFDRVSYIPGLQQIMASRSVHGFPGLESRALILKEVMGALRDTNLNMIGLFGMGGVGKTTLAKEIRSQVIEDKLFNVVVMATVSQTPDVKKIQGKIADLLGLKTKKETILVILDHLWGKIKLEDVGIPYGNDHKGCKMLMTSRSRHVLSREMSTQKDVKLKVISEEEAWSSFETIFCAVQNQKLQGIATEVAKKSAGLPLLLVRVASALKDQELEVWKDGLKQLSRLDSEEIQAKVYSALEL